jgi:hypothetical protein
MNRCVCVCVCVCTYIHIFLTYEQVCVCVCVCVCLCVHIVLTYEQVCVCVCVCVCTYIHIVLTYEQVCVCVCVYIHIYTQLSSVWTGKATPRAIYCLCVPNMGPLIYVSYMCPVWVPLYVFLARVPYLGLSLMGHIRTDEPTRRFRNYDGRQHRR